MALLKGIKIRIEADAPTDDLIEANHAKILEDFDKINRNIDTIIDERFIFSQKYNTSRIVNNYGRILHLDGDKLYSEKTEEYYKKRGLNYIVKHVSEFRQPAVIKGLLNRYIPDILVITGHDGMIRNGKNFYDINNYRNSKYFVKAVKEARQWSPNNEKLVIIAGACQSYYEAIMSEGANFASSPGRILIDFIDPLIVANEIAITNSDRIVVMSDLEAKIRNGRNAIDGMGAKGKNFVI